MASTQEYLTYVLENLRFVEGITYKKMMGEYLLYADGLLFGGIYDNAFLVKKAESLSSEGLREVIPYPGAKPMYLIDDEDPRRVASLVNMVCIDLKKGR